MEPPSEITLLCFLSLSGTLAVLHGSTEHLTAATGLLLAAHVVQVFLVADMLSGGENGCAVARVEVCINKAAYSAAHNDLKLRSQFTVCAGY